MAKVLVIGAGGQLGQCLQAVAKKVAYTDIFFAGQDAANILDLGQLASLLADIEPEYVVNCAAYTAVDKAEDEIDSATEINVTGAINLATVCKNAGSILIHISTDFVFKGDTVKLLNEDDIAEPINVYGATKLAGEKAIASILPQHNIIRTSWLYSEYANNFVKTMLKLGAERKSLNIIADQVGTPTYAIDLAHAIFAIVNSDEQNFGVFHYSNEGVTSWFDFAQAIFDLSNLAVQVNPITSSEYPTRAARPHFSVMDKRKIKKAFNLEVPYWQESLKKCLAALQHNN